MKYHQIDSKLYIKNRKNFMAQMKSSSLAVFNSNDIYPIGADSTMPFEQARDILYLSGVNQEESVLVLFPDCPNENLREILFVRETNDHIAVWEGEKLTKEGVKCTLLTGQDRVYTDGQTHFSMTIEKADLRKKFEGKISSGLIL